MMGFLRGFFGVKEATGARTVAGSAADPGVQNAAYIQDSSKRLAALDTLYKRYKATPHAQKIKSVYEKTHRIHTYLVNRSKAYELELFHIQHTDHFLNTFTVILDVHEQQQGRAYAKPLAARVSTATRKVLSTAFRKDRKEVKAVQLKNREISEQVLADTTQANTRVPALTMPQVSINTYSRVLYLKEDGPDTLLTKEIGFTSSPEEKEDFEAYVFERFGLPGAAYVGNALVLLEQELNQPHPPEMVPIIHWNGSPYALSLEGERLFPVQTFRKMK